MTVKTELKPCPFCGSEVIVEKHQLWHGSHGYYGCYEFDIRCKKCGCHIRLEKNNTIYRDEETAKEKAIEAWNSTMLRVLIHDYPYCPICGSRNRGEEDGSD